MSAIDWDKEWQQLHQRRLKASTEQFWNERARLHAQPQSQHYNDEFLALCACQPSWRVLDIGCGTGTFALPLAHAGHEVIALDFSQKMLALLAQQAHDEGVLERLRIIEGSWEDDWRTLGLSPACADLVIASRSFLTLELSASLAKLNWAAERRVCLTVGVESFPFFDARLFQALGLEPEGQGDYLMVLGALAALGITAEMRLIGSPKRDVYLSREDAGRSVLEIVGTLTTEQEALLERYFDEHLIPWQLSAAQYEHLVRKKHRGEASPYAGNNGTPSSNSSSSGGGNSNDDDGTHAAPPAHAASNTRAEPPYNGVAKDYVHDRRWAHISWNVS